MTDATTTQPAPSPLLDAFKRATAAVAESRGGDQLAVHHVDGPIILALALELVKESRDEHHHYFVITRLEARLEGIQAARSVLMDDANLTVEQVGNALDRLRIDAVEALSRAKRGPAR